MIPWITLVEGASVSFLQIWSSYRANPIERFVLVWRSEIKIFKLFWFEFETMVTIDALYRNWRVSRHILHAKPLAFRANAREMMTPQTHIHNYHLHPMLRTITQNLKYGGRYGFAVYNKTKWCEFEICSFFARNNSDDLGRAVSFSATNILSAVKSITGFFTGCVTAIFMIGVVMLWVDNKVGKII